MLKVDGQIHIVKCQLFQQINPNERCVCILVWHSQTSVPIISFDSQECLIEAI